MSTEPSLVPKLRIQFADFPYLHSETGGQEAADLGDLMRFYGTVGRTNGLRCCREIFKGRGVQPGEGARLPRYVRQYPGVRLAWTITLVGPGYVLNENG